MVRLFKMTFLIMYVEQANAGGFFNPNLQDNGQHLFLYHSKIFKSRDPLRFDFGVVSLSVFSAKSHHSRSLGELKSNDNLVPLHLSVIIYTIYAK